MAIAAGDLLRTVKDSAKNEGIHVRHICPCTSGQVDKFCPQSERQKDLATMEHVTSVEMEEEKGDNVL